MPATIKPGFIFIPYAYGDTEACKQDAYCAQFAGQWGNFAKLNSDYVMGYGLIPASEYYSNAKPPALTIIQQRFVI